MSEWLYKGEPLKEEEIPTNAMGFIYIITHLPTKRKYIGKKLLSKAATKTVKGVKKKIRKESDWKEYWSSSPTLKEMVSEEGTENFSREILTFCSSKGSVAYCEELALYQLGVLERPEEFINQNIRSRIYKSWVKADEAALLRERLHHI